MATREGAPVVALCAAIESEIADLEDADKTEFLADMKPGTEGIAYMRQVLKVFRVILDPFLSDLQAACAEADAVIATFFGDVIQSLAEKRGIPFIQTNYFMSVDEYDIEELTLGEACTEIGGASCRERV